MRAKKLTEFALRNRIRLVSENLEPPVQNLTTDGALEKQSEDLVNLEVWGIFVSISLRELTRELSKLRSHVKYHRATFWKQRGSSASRDLSKKYHSIDNSIYN